MMIKQCYICDKSRGQEDIGAFLSDIGHNVMASTYMGKTTEKNSLKPKLFLQ